MLLISLTIVQDYKLLWRFVTYIYICVCTSYICFTKSSCLLSSRTPPLPFARPRFLLAASDSPKASEARPRRPWPWPLRRSWGLARRGWKIWGSLDWFKGKSAGNPHSEWEKPMVSWRFSLKPMRGRVLSKKKGGTSQESQVRYHHTWQAGNLPSKNVMFTF